MIYSRSFGMSKSVQVDFCRAMNKTHTQIFILNVFRLCVVIILVDKSTHIAEAFQTCVKNRIHDSRARHYLHTMPNATAP